VAGFIDSTRPDYIFFGEAELNGTNQDTLNYTYAATLLAAPMPSRGGDSYLGSLVLRVPEDAKGTFTINFVPGPDTSLVDSDHHFIPLVGLNPAQVTVELGACCYGLGAGDKKEGCIDDITVAECEYIGLCKGFCEENVELRCQSDLECAVQGATGPCIGGTTLGQVCYPSGLPPDKGPECDTAAGETCVVQGGAVFSPNASCDGPSPLCERDCNNNGVADPYDIFEGTSYDCNADGTPDECEPDCNGSGAPDECDVAAGTSDDCNANEYPDECDVAEGASADCNANTIPDECETDCNENGLFDTCDITDGTSQDCNANRVPDECDIADGTSTDLNDNDVPDECECETGGPLHQLYWASSDGVHRAYLDGSCAQDLVSGRAEWIAVDSARGKMYWVAAWPSGIRRANLDGSLVEDVVMGLDQPFGLDVDVEGGKIYWAVRYLSGNESKIQRASLDGSNVEDVGTVGLQLPRGPALNTRTGRMYWGNGFSAPKVQRANLDGSQVENVVALPRRADYLAIDQLNEKVYATTPTGSPPGHIVRVNLDGSGLEELSVSDLVNPRGIAVDGGGGKIYWAEEGVGWIHKIRRANLDGSGADDVIVSESEPWDVALDLPRDCNDNGLSDDEEVAAGTSPDCNRNHVPDECEPDCNGNLVPDGCDIAGSTSRDCNDNEVPDDCEPDCNENGVADTCDITGPTSEDCTGTGVPDECEPDCDENGVPDSCDVATGTGLDCNTNELLDICEIAAGSSSDSNDNGTPDQCEEKVYVVDANLERIGRANRDGSGREDLVTRGLLHPETIAVDVAGGKMYWGDNALEKIQRANLDGSDVEDILSDTDAYGIELDVGRDHLYWLGERMIRRASLDGEDVETLVTDVGSWARGLMLDIPGGAMYWADGGIMRADLDGSGIETLPIAAGSPLGLSLDAANNVIYWTGNNSIQRSNLDGTGLEILVTGLEQPLDIVVDPAAGKMYWNDAGFDVVQRADLDGSEIETIVGDTVTRPWAIALDLPPFDCNNNGVSDDADLAGPTSEDCDADGIPDECNRDCNDNSIPDFCDIAAGTSDDDNSNGIPDECCERLEEPQPPSTAVPTNRYLSLVPGNPGHETALRVTFTDLPEPYDAWNEVSMWVGPPVEYCENSGQDIPPPEGCGPAPGQESETFFAATLQCDPFVMDWRGECVEGLCVGGLKKAEPCTEHLDCNTVIHVFHEGVVPGGGAPADPESVMPATYDVQAIDPMCSLPIEGNYSAPMTLTNSKWGDTVGDCTAPPCSPPNGRVNVTTDVTALVNSYRNLSTAPSQARSDLLGSVGDATVDQKTSMFDLTAAIDAFRGLGYPPSTLPPVGDPPCIGPSVVDTTMRPMPESAIPRDRPRPMRDK